MKTITSIRELKRICRSHCDLLALAHELKQAAIAFRKIPAPVQREVGAGDKPFTKMNEAWQYFLAKRKKLEEALNRKGLQCKIAITPQQVA